jgi:probable lipoprotein NlpC
MKILLRLALAIAMIALLDACALFRKSPFGKSPKYSRVSAEVLATAESYKGTPYRSGGNDRRGIDCSGLICQSFLTVGLKLPRMAWQQAEVGKEISLDDVRPGDLVFFVTTKKGIGSINHAGIITKATRTEIKFIHSSTSKGVREDDLLSAYWKQAFVKAMRPL